MWDHLTRLHAGFLADIDEQTLVMKIAEEFGEAVQAYIGITGQNARKGVYGTRDDLQIVRNWAVRSGTVLSPAYQRLV